MILIKSLMQSYLFLADIGSSLVKKSVSEFSALVPVNSKLLDAGAGQCQYKGLFEHCRYASLDTGVGDVTWDYSHLDFVAPLDNMPFGDNHFDFVLCTEVLEHVENPQSCLTEIFRVLRPGGQLFLTVPFFHLEHQIPHDYFRFTSYGLLMLASKAGFERSKIVIEPFGGVFLRWAYEASSLFDLYPKIRIQKKHLMSPQIFLIPFRLLALLSVRGFQIFFLILDFLDRNRGKTSVLGWKLKAIK
jgi:SAM-dependent methyltransferase